MNAFTWGLAWGGLVAYFVVFESIALYQSGKVTGRGEADPRDTLSEHLWWLFGVNNGAGVGLERRPTRWAMLRRVALAAGVLWLGIHLLFGGTYF